MKPTTLDALARARVRAGRRAPWRRRLDDHGTGVTVTLPDPLDLLPLLEILPGQTLFRRGSGLETPDGTAPDFSLHELARALVTAWAAMPDREDAGEVFTHLRMLARVSPDRSALDYALAVTRGWRKSLPAAPARERAPRAPGRSGAERVRDHRTRRREAETASARWWLRSLFDDDSPYPPGARVDRRDLYTRARSVLEEFADDGEPIDDDNPDGPVCRVPSAHTFYRAADRVLGPSEPSRSRSRVYTIREHPLDDEGDTTVSVTSISPDEITEALQVREIVAMLRDHKQRHAMPGAEPARAGRGARRDGVSGRFVPAATGTDDGAVVDLEQRRRSR